MYEVLLDNIVIRQMNEQRLQVQWEEPREEL